MSIQLHLYSLLCDMALLHSYVDTQEGLVISTVFICYGCHCGSVAAERLVGRPG